NVPGVREPRVSRPRRSDLGPSPPVRGAGDQRSLRDDRGGEARGTGEARRSPEDPLGFMAADLRSEAGAAFGAIQVIQGRAQIYRTLRQFVGTAKQEVL